MFQSRPVVYTNWFSKKYNMTYYFILLRERKLSLITNQFDYDYLISILINFNQFLFNTIIISSERESVFKGRREQF